MWKNIAQVYNLEKGKWLHLGVWILIFCFHQIWIIASLEVHWFVSSYSDPFVLGMLASFLYQREPIFFDSDSTPGSFGFREFVAMWLVLSLVSELVFPLMSTEFVRDIYDIISLGAGILYYVLFLKFRVCET